jgi:hypothetical protein
LDNILVIWAYDSNHYRQRYLEIDLKKGYSLCNNHTYSSLCTYELYTLNRFYK